GTLRSSWWTRTVRLSNVIRQQHHLSKSRFEIMDEATSNNPMASSTGTPSERVLPTNVSESEEGAFGTSDVWPHFTRMNWSDKPNRLAGCKYCPKQLKCASTSGTSSLRIHLQRCRVYPYSDVNLKSNRTPNVQATGVHGTSNASPSFVAQAYDPTVSRMKLARMIIIDELAFRHVEREGF
ncbi:unnamed protein product, partial [Linum tenue]